LVRTFCLLVHTFCFLVRTFCLLVHTFLLFGTYLLSFGTYLLSFGTYLLSFGTYLFLIFAFPNGKKWNRQTISNTNYPPNTKTSRQEYHTGTIQKPSTPESLEDETHLWYYKRPNKRTWFLERKI
jgi:hypothetical protein